MQEKLTNLLVPYVAEIKLISKKVLNKIELRKINFHNEKFFEEENKRTFSLKNDSLEKLISSLKVEEFPFEVLNQDLIKVEGKESDFLLAISARGIESLAFIQENYKNEDVKQIITKKVYELYILNEGTIFKICNSIEDIQLRLVPKPIILKIPKCIKKEIVSPKDIQKMYQDVKEIVGKNYIKNLSLDSIFYIETKDKYIILKIEDFVPLNENVEIDLVQFLYYGNIYQYKGKPLSFEEHSSIIA